MRVTACVSILMITLLAGCADEAAAPEEEGFAADEELQATETTGVIRGVVVDPTITPIAGAVVRIAALDLEAVTLEDGSFGFKDLAPGVYFLEADAVGYAGTQAQATVEAGVDKPDVVRVLLEANPSEAPAFNIMTYKANLRCGLAIPRNPVGIGAFGCSVIRGTEEIVGENNAQVLMLDGGVPSWLQVDMFWESTQPAGDSLTLDIAHCCDNDDIADNSSTFGPSPLHAWATHDEIMAHEGGAIATEGIEIRVFPAGNEAIMSNTGERLGVILDQQVEWFTTTWFNAVPPEGWNFIDNGAPEF